MLEKNKNYWRKTEKRPIHQVHKDMCLANGNTLNQPIAAFAANRYGIPKTLEWNVHVSIF